jgi:hypothetical protein
MLTAISAPISAGAQQTVADSSLLTVERIFGSSDFDGDYFGPALWLDDSTYTILEPAQAPATGRDIVRYDAASGRRTRIFPTINYKNCAGRTLLDSFALWVAPISKRSKRIEIFACGHVAKRERFTNHALFQRA